MWVVLYATRILWLAFIDLMKSLQLDALLTLLKAEFRLKMALTVLLNIVFWAGYGFLGRYAFFPVYDMNATALDRMIPFLPEPWSWIYLSYYALSGGLPWFLPDRASIRRYVVCVAVMVVVSFSAFLVLPTRVIRPAMIGDGFAMNLIVGLDGTMNACPSLHAAFIISMSGLAWRVFGTAIPRWLIVFCSVWFAAVLYSTIAIRQHYVMDLVAGALTGGLAHWVAWRGARAAATMPVKSGTTSHDGMR
jgi:membrane-associated phospholipid phosphatase